MIRILVGTWVTEIRDDSTEVIGMGQYWLENHEVAPNVYVSNTETY